MVEGEYIKTIRPPKIKSGKTDFFYAIYYYGTRKDRENNGNKSP